MSYTVIWFHPTTKGGVGLGRPLSLSTILKFETFIDKDRARDLAKKRKWSDRLLNGCRVIIREGYCGGLPAYFH